MNMKTLAVVTLSAFAAGCSTCEAAKSAAPGPLRLKFMQEHKAGRAKADARQAVLPHAGSVPFKLGVAGYTFSKEGLDKGLEIMKAIDCHYLCHKADFVPYAASDAELSVYKAKIAAAGVETLATGPLYADNEKALRDQFEFAKRMGIKVLVGVPFDMNPKIKGITDDEARLAIAPPDEWRIESDRVLDIVDRLVKEYDVKYAVHNHGPDNAALYATAEAALARIGNRDKRIGVCLDIGHEMRAGKDPAAFIRSHGDRVFDVHLKNIKIDPKYNFAMQGPRGELDIPAVFQALKDVGYTGVYHIEYEKDFEDNALPLAESVGYYRGVMDSIK